MLYDSWLKWSLREYNYYQNIVVCWSTVVCNVFPKYWYQHVMAHDSKSPSVCNKLSKYCGMVINLCVIYIKKILVLELHGSQLKLDLHELCKWNYTLITEFHVFFPLQVWQMNFKTKQMWIADVRHFGCLFGCRVDRYFGIVKQYLLLTVSGISAATLSWHVFDFEHTVWSTCILKNWNAFVFALILYQHLDTEVCLWFQPSAEISGNNISDTYFVLCYWTNICLDFYDIRDINISFMDISGACIRFYFKNIWPEFYHIRDINIGFMDVSGG